MRRTEEISDGRWYDAVQQDSGNQKPRAVSPVHLDRIKTAGFLTLPLFILLIAVFVFLNIKTDFEPPLVLPVMNTLFLGIIPVFIASVAYRTYRINGSASVLLLGSGMLVFGLGSIAAGWLIGLPDGSNIAITIYNTSAFIGSALSLAAVLLVLTGAIPSIRKTETSVPFLAYGGAIAFIALFSYAAIEGAIPPFFIPVSGPTVLRQVVLSYAGVMYSLTAVLFFVLYQRKRDDFFFWFSLALGLIATGLFAVLFLSAMGSLTVWTGRIAQYLGACFALVAILVARESATRSGISLPAQFGTFFDREATTSAILAAAQESIWLFGTDDTIQMANPTALERLGGRSAREVIGHHYQEFMSKELAQSRKARLEEVMRKKEPVRFEDERNGILFDHSFYPVFDDDGNVTGIAAFSRDITAVRNAEDALISINEELTATQEKLQKNLNELVWNEQKLRESEDRMSFALETSHIGAWDLDLTDHTARRSPGHDRVFGYSKLLPEWTYEMFLDHVLPEDRASVDAKFRHATETGGDWNFECRIRRTDGEIRWIWAAGRHRTDSPGSRARMAGIVQDITDRKQAEEALKKARDELETRVEERTAALQGAIAALSTERHRLYDVLEGLPAYVCLLDADYRMPFANKTFRETFAEPRGRRCYEFLFDRTKPCETCDSYRVMKTRAPHHWYWTGPNGRDYDIYDFPFTDTDGSFMILEMGIDITERMKAEEELRKAHALLEVRVEERTAELAQANTTLQNEIAIRRDAEGALRETSQYLEKLITYANAPIIVWDRDFRITRFNHAAEILTGKKAEDMIGERIEVIFPQKYVHEVMDLIRQTMTGEQLHVVELPVLHRSGSVRVVLWNSASLYGPDKETIESTIAQGQDITVRKRAEAELQRKNRELQTLNKEITATQEELQQKVDELNRSEEALRRNEAELREALSEKEVLLAEIHHRVKNNLTAFISLLSLEGSYEESPAGLALKKDLQNRARSMALIHETLYRTGKYSRVEMGMYLSTLVEQIASSFDPEHHIILIVSGEGISLDLARATPCGLIVNELVTNSFKYAFPPSFDCQNTRGEPCTITVSIAGEEDAYVLTVRDNGIGLPAGFDALQARSLGLKLVNFLARHQLRATVDLLSGEGTAFEFRFPVNQQHGRES